MKQKDVKQKMDGDLYCQGLKHHKSNLPTFFLRAHFVFHRKKKLM